MEEIGKDFLWSHIGTLGFCPRFISISSSTLYETRPAQMLVEKSKKQTVL